MQVAAQVHEQQPIVALFSEETEQESFWSEYRTVDTASFLRVQHGIFAAQLQQIAMQLVGLAMSFALGMIQLAALKGRR